MKVFFSKDYSNFDASRHEFRKKIVRFLQISISMALIAAMVIIFPFREMNFYFYIILPGYLILNNIICFLIQRKTYERLITVYLIIMQLLIPSLVLELSVFASTEQPSKKTLFVGLQGGLFFSICFVLELPCFTTPMSSLIYLIHITVRQYSLEIENIYGASFTMLSVIFFINYANYKREMINFGIWISLKKSNEGLFHFQQLIQNFPSQLLVLDNHSLTSDAPMYSNEEAIKLQNEIIPEGNQSLQAFLDCFDVERPLISTAHNETNPFIDRSKLLSNHISDIFKRRGMSSGDIQTLQARLKRKKTTKKGSGKILESDKNAFKNEKRKKALWELKIGWIEWNQSDALIIIFNDVSISSKIRELKKMDKSKDKLLATVSHELRTPLNGIIGMLDVVDEEIPKTYSKIKQYLQIAKSSAKTLLFMINDILDISQIRNGSLRLNFDNVLLNDIIDKVLPLIRIQIKGKNLKFEYQNECPRNIKVNVDPIRIQQILINLLGNACKFTSEGFIKLFVKPSIHEAKKEEISFRKSEFKSGDEDIVAGAYTNIEPETNNTVLITVEDTGLGISEEKLPNLFKMFGKLEDKNNSNGVGLGLAISQSLATKMHPSGIKVESIYGRGSRFSFSVFCAKDNCNIPYLSILEDETNSRKSKSSSVSPKASLKNINVRDEIVQKFKVLVVEDDLVNHLVIELYLKNLADKVLADKVYNGLEAINKVQEKAKAEYFYDLIIMDCDMPIMDGFQAAKFIEELNKNGSIPDVKIVALTANASVSDQEKCIQHGISETWTKPISKDEFLQKMEELMENI